MLILCSIFAFSLAIGAGYVWGHADGMKQPQYEAFGQGVLRGLEQARREQERKRAADLRGDWWSEPQNVAALERTHAGQTHRGDL